MACENCKKLRDELGEAQRKLADRKAAAFNKALLDGKYIQQQNRIRELETELLRMRRDENVSTLKEQLRVSNGG